MKLIKLICAATFALGAGSTAAQEYNHGNHNDPHHTFGINSVNTISCGSSSLASCISAVNLEAITKQLCRNKVTDDSDGLLPWGTPYYHTVQQYAVRVLSALDTNGGSGPVAYTVDVQYSCSGYLHPGIKHKFE
ncbi:MAG: hypothetical protein OQJ89_08870 [Kangiellaceae bacterium]|nr:hypothetical protein [Kangiellaceae bacterium]MCW9000409.1 hypothetical protein [Kangiellaceae bacterium]MCW9017062.1 hypothetical protein [Kangiellaceae bacterium]